MRARQEKPAACRACDYAKRHRTVRAKPACGGAEPTHEADDIGVCYAGDDVMIMRGLCRPVARIWQVGGPNILWGGHVYDHDVWIF